MPGILIVCGAGIVSGKEIMALELGDGLARSGTACFVHHEFLEQRRFPGSVDAARASCLHSPHRLHLCDFDEKVRRDDCRADPTLARSAIRLFPSFATPPAPNHYSHELAPPLLLLPFLKPDRDLFWLHEVVPDLPQYRRVFRYLERRLGAFVCVSQATACALRKIGIKELKIRVIHNGLTDPADSVDVAPVPSEHFRIGIVGQINPGKGHDDLLEAFGMIARKHSDTELHIFGRGDTLYTMELARRSVDLGVAGRVKWHDFVSDRRRIFTALDVCVVPSRSQDPFPTTAIEACFFGMPTIVTRRGGLPEIIEHEVNGLVVEAERPTEIADALSRLIEQPSLQRMLGMNARRRAVEHFGRDRFLREFLSLVNAERSK